MGATAGEDGPTPAGSPDEPSDVDDPFDELEPPVEAVDSPEARQRVQEAVDLPANVGRRSLGHQRLRRRRGAAGEPPLWHPDVRRGRDPGVGTFVAARSAPVAGTLGFAVATVAGTPYVADIQERRSIPRAYNTRVGG